MSPQDIRTVLYRLDQQDKHLEEIKTQVKQTNGRVSKLEIWQARLEGARWAVSWVPTVATGTVVGVIAAAASKLL